MAPLTLARLHNKKILVVGRGKEGLVALRYLKKNLSAGKITAVDRKDGADYLAQQEKFDIAIKSPGVRPELLKIPYTTPTNLFFEKCRATIIGVTGTKGKSTTASLIHHILKVAGKKTRLVGNIGKPALAELLKKNPPAKNEFVVMELSSYQTGDLAYAPHISVMTSFFPEHLDYHGSLKNYWQAKANIVAHAAKDDLLVYHDRYAKLRALARIAPCRTIPFAATLPFATKEFRLLGKHNIENMKGCYAVAHELGIPDAVIERAMRTFKPLPHRLQNVGEYHDITFWDDAISTTPQSAIAALQTIPRVQTIFLGGQDRGFDFAALGRQLARRKVNNIVLFPDSGKNILKEIKKIATYRPRIFSTSSMKAAVEFAYRYTPKGAACLLSCASPSYSLWKNFEEKGEEFQKWVRKLR